MMIPLFRVYDAHVNKNATYGFDLTVEFTSEL